MLRVLADENIPAVEHYLGSAARVERFAGRHLDAGRLDGADALLVRSVTPVDGRLLKGSTLRFVGSATSGHEHIDRPGLEARGIGFAYAPGSNANAVVEYVLAAIAAVGDTLEKLVAGGVVGIVGFGYVGRALARRLAALDIAFRVFDPWLDNVPHACDLPEILTCDVISLHCELTRALPWPSEHLLGPGELRTVPAQSVLINASRGAVVDNRALLRRLGESRAPAVVLDVWEGEPDIDADLLDAVTLGTAHIAGYSQDGKVLATRMLCDALGDFLDLELPHVDGPLAPPPPLQVPGDLRGAALLRHLLQARYDICRDDALLRGAVLGAGRVEARENFDELRRHYAGRRELACGVAVGPLAVPQDAALFRALDCPLVPGEAA